MAGEWGVQTVESFNHYSERIQLSTGSRKLWAKADLDRQQGLKTKLSLIQASRAASYMELRHKIRSIC